MAYILVLNFPVVIHEEVLIDDGINVSVSREFDGWPGKTRFMSLGIYGEGAEEFLGLVEGFFDGRGSFSPVDHGVEFL